MKIKQIEQIIKANKSIHVVNAAGCQWLGNGAAMYPLYSLPRLEQESIFTMLDISNDKREKYIYVESKEIPGLSLEDSDPRDREVERYNITLNANCMEMIPLGTSQGIRFIDSRYLKPFRGLSDGPTFYERAGAGELLRIAVKSGLILLGLIMPVRPLDMVCEPSTDTFKGRDDFAGNPLFACFDCNYTIDANTLEPVVHAIKGVYGRFESAPADSLVGVIQMTGWVRRTSTETTKTVEYKAQKTEGFMPLPEAVRASDNRVRPYVIHAKYAAGLDDAGKLTSISGVQPATLRPGSVGSTSISHDGQIALWRQRGNQYGGFALCDIAFYQLMLEIKYAVLGNAQVMSGCRSYSQSYTAVVSESGVKRVLLPVAQGNSFVVDSCVSLGSSSNRAAATCYDTCDIVKITSIEDVQLDNVQYKAVVLDTEETFDTSEGTTYITTQPWRTGSTDAVRGNDGSPTNNTSGKEPFKIQGVELMLGIYEVPGDTTCQEDAEGKYTIYTNRKAENCKAGGSGTDPVTVGTITKEVTAGWKYVAELNWDENNQEAYMLATQYGATSSTGYRAAHYLDAATTVGWRELLAFGYLSNDDYSGLACAHLNVGLGYAYWDIGARASGTGSNRGEWNVLKEKTL